MEMMEKVLPTKEELVEEAIKYENTKSSIAYSKGVRRGIQLSLHFVQDYWKGKLEKLIK